MKASDVMTRTVVTVQKDTKVAAAAALMAEKRVSGLPVVDMFGQVVGMFTEGDLLYRAETGTEDRKRSRFLEFLFGPGRSAEDYVQAHCGHVGDLMTEPVISVTGDTDLRDVVALMTKKKIRRVAVIEFGTLAGIVTRSDLVRALVAHLPPILQGGTDEDIRARLVAELENQHWSRAANVSIAVKDRVITLEGFIHDGRVRRALNVAAANVAEGVKVEDRLVWMDPSCGVVVDA